MCVSEKAFFEDPSWLAEGFELLKQWAGYKRDYLLPRIKGDGTLERKMASYADAMAASVHLLAMAGLPIMVRTYWSEHSGAKLEANPACG